MKSIKGIIASLIMVVLLSSTIFAYVIGSDENGIICFENDIEPVNNAWLTLDLDFDGNFEEYYFNKDGYLECNKYIGEFYTNEYGQKLANGTKLIYEADPSVLQTLMIDNIAFYYINKVKSYYTKNWEIDENKKARITIQLPEIYGANTTLTNKVNDLIKERGLELLKLYAKNEVYNKNARKFYVSIDKFDKKKAHILNFIPNFNDKFYFNFTVVITNDKNENTTKYIGVAADPINNTCEIQNTEHKNLNYLKYTDETESVVITNTYNSRYEDLVKDIKDEYIEKLQEYLDNADSYVSEYENKTDNREALLRAVKNYIKDIENIYNTYDKKAKNYKKDALLDDETYKKLCADMRDTLKKYKTVLANMLAGDINAIKEENNNDRMQE